MNVRTLLIALAGLGAGLGAAQAATTATPDHPTTTRAAAARPAAPAKQGAATRHASTTKYIATAKHTTKSKHQATTTARNTAMDRVHQRVAFLREAEQRRWIGAELQRNRLDRAQAASLWPDAADLAREQALLTRRGHELVDKALALSHRQDLLDWAIRSGEVACAPNSLRSLG